MNENRKQYCQDLMNETVERNIESALKVILKDFNSEDDWEQDYSNTNGRCDLISFSNKVIIEVKSRRKINLEENKKQLLKYLDAVADEYENTLWGEGKDKVWRGIITDGKQWACYDYDSSNKTLIDVKGGKHQGFQADHLINDFIQDFIYNRWDGTQKIKIPSKENLLDNDFLPKFKEIEDTVKSEQIETNQDYKTQIGVWRIVLENAGVIPSDPGSLQATIFWRHSFIVTVSRMIIAYLDNPSLTSEALIKQVGSGFHAWLLSHRKLKITMEKLATEIKKYQWNFYSKDNLKYLYHALTPSEQRKEFGEFYTPDYLAKDVVVQVLDDTWLDQSIERAYDLIVGKKDVDGRYLGVLDPSCGSGTFLLRSAKYIDNRIRKKHRDKLNHASKIVARLVHGIDVHPIAVEMSKATLRSVLSDRIEPNEYRICLGSSLRSSSEDKKPKLWAINIKTTKTNFEIPNQLYSDPKFPQIVKKINESILDKEELPSFENVSDTVKNQAHDLFDTLKDVIQKEGNHIWEWFISNQIYLELLFSKGVGRIVGNPPWLVQKNAQDTQRKKLYKDLAKDEGVYTQTSQHANADLAAMFSARSISLYLPKKGGVFGWVLPKSPIKGQTWEKWRSGNWTNVKVKHTEMWDLTDLKPPVFSHSPNGCSVVLGETIKSMDPHHPLRIIDYHGDYENDPQTTIREVIRFQASEYLNRFKCGVLYSPFCYYQVIEKKDIGRGLSRITVQRGTKAQWKGCGFDGDVESQCLLPLMDSKQLKGLRYKPQMWLIAPLDDRRELMLPDEGRKKRYPKLHAYWQKCQVQYLDRRKKNTPIILEKSWNYDQRINKHLRACDSFRDLKLKVVYNSSGNRLRAMRIPCHVVANLKLYYILCESEQEAQYLVGVINAPIMQAAWRQSKTSKMDYHKSPFKSIPIPLFDEKNHQHLEIAEEIDRLEKLEQGDRPPDFSRLDPLLQELLPYHTSLYDF